MSQSPTKHVAKCQQLLERSSAIILLENNQIVHFFSSEKHKVQASEMGNSASMPPAPVSVIAHNNGSTQKTPCVLSFRRAVLVHCVIKRLGYTMNICKIIVAFGDMPHPCVSRARGRAFNHCFNMGRTIFMNQAHGMDGRDSICSVRSGTMRYENDCPSGASLTPWSISYVSTAKVNEPWQWCGWRVHCPNTWWVRVSCWIKFIDAVPPPSNNFGLKIHGATCNDWVRECKADEWRFVSATRRCTGGDGTHVLLIFDSIAQPVTVRFTDLRYELISE